MNVIRRWTTVAMVCGLAASVATAGALDECAIKGDHAAVSRCLLDADREARASLHAAEGAAELDADELAAGYVLVCQARPTSPHVVLTFDS